MRKVVEERPSPLTSSSPTRIALEQLEAMDSSAAGFDFRTPSAGDSRQAFAMAADPRKRLVVPSGSLEAVLAGCRRTSQVDAELCSPLWAGSSSLHGQGNGTRDWPGLLAAFAGQYLGEIGYWEVFDIEEHLVGYSEHYLTEDIDGMLWLAEQYFTAWDLLGHLLGRLVDQELRPWLFTLKVARSWVTCGARHLGELDVDDGGLMDRWALDVALVDSLGLRDRRDTK